MNTDELRAADIETAVRWAQRHTGPGDTSEEVAGLVLLHLHEQNAALREEIDALTGQHERDERENAELRRVLGRYVAIGDSASLEDHMGQQPEASMLWDEMRHEAHDLLAGEVQDADVSPPVKFKPGSDVVHAHDCPCWTCEGYREDMAREVQDAAE